MDNGGTYINGPEDKKIDDDEWGFISETWHRQTLCVKKEGGRRLSIIEDCVDASIQGLKDQIEKNKERLITANN